MFLYRTTFLSYLITISYSQLNTGEIKERCPDDKDVCALKAVQGDCFGSSLKASVLRKKCPCTCDELHHERIQACCTTVGAPESEFCLPLCGYNTTTQQLSSTIGVRCATELSTWAYCASDATDNTQCCEAKGVPEQCIPFCRGAVPTCNIQELLTFESCLLHIRTILFCHKEGLGPRPQFDSTRQSECEQK